MTRPSTGGGGGGRRSTSAEDMPEGFGGGADVGVLERGACMGSLVQVARHVILLHPYCTPSATYPEAVSFSSLKAFEQQAIGRVRRYPQTKPVVVYRLYAADTVEEVLYRGGYAETAAASATATGAAAEKE